MSRRLVFEYGAPDDGGPVIRLVDRIGANNRTPISADVDIDRVIGAFLQLHTFADEPRYRVRLIDPIPRRFEVRDLNRREVQREDLAPAAGGFDVIVPELTGIASVVLLANPELLPPAILAGLSGSLVTDVGETGPVQEIARFPWDLGGNV